MTTSLFSCNRVLSSQYSLQHIEYILSKIGRCNFEFIATDWEILLLTC